ncbi:uncharacterized protein LOC127751220 [Frankliniella occidentalis]|uniref:Uncharacterized protein LOC127751220 n=1 Tax=Frankliniella occidentalis TaxID=133901 RepID=A0A9C6X6S2_FRAOC|nr:uncharacterized protein LOC127751220 [Frankliniella occidentalis]
MVTKVWHPNISTNGKICVDILNEKWKPGMTLLELLEGMQGLLRAPNPDSPLSMDAAAMMKLVDQTMYLSTCVAYTYTFAFCMLFSVLMLPPVK